MHTHPYPHTFGNKKHLHNRGGLRCPTAGKERPRKLHPNHTAPHAKKRQAFRLLWWLEDDRRGGKRNETRAFKGLEESNGETGILRCIDTDFLVAVLRGKKEAQNRMTELDREGRQATTSVSAFELFYGAHKSEESKNNLGMTNALLGRMDILPLDLDSSDKAGKILTDLAKEGGVIDFRDALIAGISLSNSLTVMTRNKDHFSRIKGLKVESW